MPLGQFGLARWIYPFGLHDLANMVGSFGWLDPGPGGDSSEQTRSRLNRTADVVGDVHQVSEQIAA